MGIISDNIFREGRILIPGGVNSPVRAFKSVGGNPIFIDRAKGSKMFDVDGKEYIDYVGSWGPMIVGHANKHVTKAINEAVAKGSSFGAPSPLEVALASKIVKAVPSIEMVRMVNSGTEAAMSAIRLARAYTNRDRIIKFDGCYHGHADSLLVKVGSGGATLGIPDSLGVPKDFAKYTTSLPYNDIDALTKIMEKEGDSIAAVIIEPIVGNAGVIRPIEGFLEAVRKVTEEQGTLLIVDEVMTGFRVAYGGAQTIFNIKPDLTCLGKIIGGGLPVGAYGGRRDIMSMVAPEGAVYQAGTLSGNPVAMAAGLATLEVIAKDNDFYPKLEAKTKKLTAGIREGAAKAGIPIYLPEAGSMFSIFFTDKEVRNYADAQGTNVAQFREWFHLMLDEGIYLPPSPFESYFVSSAHTGNDIDRTIEAAKKAFKGVTA
ncbi:MAG: glutamate-1-semialdehyde 2,1-aminomutase [Nitrospinae bacterium]|nr:glutamate-1-semialdehyde 2,1-aminomutase [Nitrospinota bacterium]